MKNFFQAAVLAAAALLSPWLADCSQSQPVPQQWNYGFQSNISTAHYPGNVIIDGSCTGCGSGSIVWPTSADLVISNGTNSPAGLAPVNGDCVIGAGGAWTAAACPGAVTSVFGRTGVVVAAANDYNFNQLAGNIAVSQMNSGTNADSSHYWRGDNTWAAISGGVSSVGGSFTGGLISVAGSPVTSTGTIAFTVAGTSGGIPYFNSATTWATSAALTANMPVIGGGAGVAPSVGTVSGNTTKFVTESGSVTSGNGVKADASGNLVDLTYVPAAVGTGAVLSSSPTTVANDFNRDCKQFTINAAGINIPIPAASSLNTGGCFEILNPTNNTYTITPNGTDNLNSANSAATIYGNTFVKVTSNGTADFANVVPVSWDSGGNGVAASFVVSQTNCLGWLSATCLTSTSNGLMSIKDSGGTHVLIFSVTGKPAVTGTGTPTIDATATNSSGTVTAGASATSVIITFSAAWAARPHCVVTDESTLVSFIYSVSTTAITITQTANSNNLIDYHCFG